MYSSVGISYRQPLLRVGHPEVLRPQLIHDEPHHLVVISTANVVAHMNVEQGKRTVRVGMEREASLVGIQRHGLGNGLGLRRLSHLSLSFCDAHHSTLFIDQCQHPSTLFFPYNIVRYDIANTVPIKKICRKVLLDKHLHQSRPAALAASPYTLRVYVKS